MKKLLVIGICVFAGCSYIPHKNYKIKTMTGKVITLSCPEIDPTQSTFSYFYSKECYVIKD